jgi:hypothetical protein
VSLFEIKQEEKINASGEDLITGGSGEVPEPQLFI